MEAGGPGGRDWCLARLPRRLPSRATGTVWLSILCVGAVRTSLPGRIAVTPEPFGAHGPRHVILQQSEPHVRQQTRKARTKPSPKLVYGSHAEWTGHRGERRELLWAALALFFSGAVSLALEVTWTRWLRLAFGSTTWAVSTILVAYMLGLGLGGLWGARLASRPHRGWFTYGLLEIGVGVYALFVPWLFERAPWVQEVLFAQWDFWLATLGRFALAVTGLLLPTVFMGATLPVLVSAVIEARPQLGRGVGLLYGINTFGAVAGVLGATYLLFPALGLWRTNLVAALMDLAIGALAAFYLVRRTQGSVAPAPGTEERWQPVPTQGTRDWLRAAWLPLLVYGSVGFTSLAYEVSWTRALSLTVGSSTYAFATMLAAFLIGIALGALFIRRRVDRISAPTFAFGIALLLLAAASVGTSVVLQRVPDLLPWLFVYLGISEAGVTAGMLIISLLAMLPPTFLLGALFPLLVRGLARSAPASLATGSVYFANTVGSALGAFTAGFWAIPNLGLQNTLLALASINVAAAAVLLTWQAEASGRRKQLALVGAAALGVALWAMPRHWDTRNLTRGVFRFPLDEVDVGVAPIPLEGLAGSQLVYYREGWNSVVSVHRELGELGLRVNGKADASSHGDLPTQVLLGQVGMLLGGQPRRVAVIGLASGVTAGSVALHDGAQVDVIEIEPAMVEASHFFDELNHRPLERPNVRLVLDDARSFLAGTPQRYDLIISEPSNPWMSGAANLFTQEFFRLARNALSPGGKLVQWVQVYSISEEAIASILRALQLEFPYVYGFAPQFNAPDLLFVASGTPLAWEAVADLTAAPAAVRADLARVGVYSAADLWSLLLLVPESVQELAARAPTTNSDDNMFVELVTPWTLYDTAAGMRNWQVLESTSKAVARFWREAPGINSPAALAELGLAYVRRGNVGIARALYDTGREHGGGPEVEALGCALEVAPAEDSEQARSRLLPQLRRAAGARPHSHELQLLLGQWELDQANHLQALEQADRALRLRPDDDRGRALRFEALLGLGRHEEAWLEAERLLPSPYAVRNLELKAKAAQAALQSGRHQQAAQLLREYLEWYPDSPQEWEALATAHERAGNSSGAALARRNAAQAKRNVVLLLHQQARRLALVGDRDGAGKRLRTVLLFDPSYAPAREDLHRLGVM